MFAPDWFIVLSYSFWSDYISFARESVSWEPVWVKAGVPRSRMDMWGLQLINWSNSNLSQINCDLSGSNFIWGTCCHNKVFCRYSSVFTYWECLVMGHYRSHVNSFQVTVLNYLYVFFAVHMTRLNNLSNQRGICICCLYKRERETRFAGM
jgi:hypothetical protein